MSVKSLQGRRTENTLLVLSYTMYDYDYGNVYRGLLFSRTQCILLPMCLPSAVDLMTAEAPLLCLSGADNH